MGCVQLHYHTADHIKLPLNKKLLGDLTSAHKLLCHLVLEMFAADVHACYQCVLYGKSLKKMSLKDCLDNVQQDLNECV